MTITKSRYWPECTTRTIRHDFQSTPYFQALERAAFYRWKAQRGRALAGNDPLTGMSREAMAKRRFNVMIEESRVAHKAMARYWLGQAKQIRAASRFSVAAF